MINKRVITNPLFVDYDTFISLVEAYQSIYSEGKIPWDDTNRPLRSGWTPREKNRAKRISTGVEDPNTPIDDKKLERYGKLKTAHDNLKTVKDKKSSLHKDEEDYGLGRHNAFFKSEPRMPSESEKGNSDGLRRMPRNAPKKEVSAYLDNNKFGAPKDSERDKFYSKGPKGLREPKN